MKTVTPRDMRIPRKPLLWMAAALLFTLPSMFGSLALWVPLLFLTTLAAKFWMEPRDYRLRSNILVLVLSAAALAAIVMSYGSIQGIEPGVSLIVTLMGLKILEAHTAREFQVMVMVAFIVCLCGFFLSQDLAIALCLLVSFGLLVVALVQFHGGISRARPAIRIAATLLAQAAPLVVLLFLLFPRIVTGFRIQLGQSRYSAAGFSDHLAPGDVALLANSSEVAFRAEFPDGAAPPPGSMYWRGVMMWQAQGFDWKASASPVALPRNRQPAAAGDGIRQWITIEPHGGRWVFALDWPGEAPPGTGLAPGNYLWSGQPIRKPRRYEVRSYPEIREKKLHPREQRMYMDPGIAVSPEIRNLVSSWHPPGATGRDVISAALLYFRNEGFRYSLSPGEYRKNDIDEFLFRRRLGFCEHYAAAFATLMRVAGIPSRVVSGYLGGEYNEIGRFYVVRQSDAHAWCEVWLPELGWQRVDPTAVVAPDRVNLGLNAFLERRANDGQTVASGTFVRGFVRSPVFTKMRLAWQTLNYAWDTRVLSFDADAQESLFANIGMPDQSMLIWLGAALVASVLFVGIYLGWSQWRSRPPGDQVLALYHEFCERLGKLGVTRESTEGPQAFARRASGRLPNEAEQIAQISTDYVTLRYSSEPSVLTLDRFAELVRGFAK